MDKEMIVSDTEDEGSETEFSDVDEYSVIINVEDECDEDLELGKDGKMTLALLTDGLLLYVASEVPNMPSCRQEGRPTGL